MRAVAWTARAISSVSGLTARPIVVFLTGFQLPEVSRRCAVSRIEAAANSGIYLVEGR